MEFAYKEYMIAFWQPIIIVTLLALGGLILHFVGPIKKVKTNIAEKIFYTLVLVTFGCKLIIPLFNGGFYLLTERNVEPELWEGNVENVVEFNDFIFPYDIEYGDGIEIVIDGKAFKCYEIITDYVSIGDKVKITYLPRSNLILSIYRTAETGDGS